MKRFLLVSLLMICIPRLAAAQVEVGLGIAAPVSGRYIPVSGSVDGGGVVHIDRTLDASPQIVVEIHRMFKTGALAVGPMLGFSPKIDFGLTSNQGSETPIGAGFGILAQVPSKRKQHVNVGIMWLITQPINQVNPDWRDGFQAPRDNLGRPLPIIQKTGSVNRIMLTFTVSGLF